MKLPTEGLKSASLLINSRTESYLMRDIQRLCADDLAKLKESNVKTPSRTPKRKQSSPDEKENAQSDKKVAKTPISNKKLKSGKTEDAITPRKAVDAKVLLFGKAKKAKPLSGLYPLVGDYCAIIHTCRQARLIH